MKQECRTCGAISTTPRCRPCTRTAKAPYHDPAYLKARAQLIAAEPWCHTPGGCPYRGMPTTVNPLTADHIDPLATTTHVPGVTPRLRVLCMRCNSARGWGRSES